MTVALFLLGFLLAKRAIVALYGVIDLWYTIRSAYARVTRGIVVSLGAIAILLLLLEPARQRPFVYGIVAFVAFYVSLYLLRNVYFTVRAGRASAGTS